MERSRRLYPSLCVSLSWQLLLTRGFVLEWSKEIQVTWSVTRMCFDNVVHVSFICILDVSMDFMIQKHFRRCFFDSSVYVEIRFCPVASDFSSVNFVAFQVIASLVLYLGMIFSHSHNAHLMLPRKGKQPNKNFVTKYKICLKVCIRIY